MTLLDNCCTCRIKRRDSTGRIVGEDVEVSLHHKGHTHSSMGRPTATTRMSVGRPMRQ